MTTSATTPYKAPKGFMKGYSFDKSGNVFAGDKQLNGIKLDVNSIKLPDAPAQQQFGMASVVNPGAKRTQSNPFLTSGGTLSRLSADDKGNIFAHIAAPNTPALGSGYSGMGGSYMSMNGVQNFGTPMANSSVKVKLSGVQLDPERTSKAANKPLGDNNVYLREDQEGLYFAQINKGADIAAYSYSKYQGSSLPTGGPSAPTAGRKQGGNAGRGVAVTASTSSLLGS